MVPEKANTRSIIHRLVFAHVVFVENSRHRRDVLVAESQVDPRKAGVPGLHRLHPKLSLGRDHVPGKNLFRQRHWPFLRFDRRQKDFFLHSRNVEWKQPAILDHLARNVVFARGEFTERNFLPGPDPLDDREVGRSQQSEILTILLVDALDVLRDHQLDPGRHFRIR